MTIKNFAALFLTFITITATTGCKNKTELGSFVQFSKIYEPSDLVVRGNKVLIVEDEPEHPFSLVTFKSTVAKEKRVDSIFGSTSFDDLEGLTLSKKGKWVYGITSLSRNKKGKRKKEREIFFTAKINKKLKPKKKVIIIRDLRDKLEKRYPSLKQAFAEKKVKKKGGFNVEGLAFDKAGKRLLIGLRSPIIDGHALILPINNPKQIHKKNWQPDFGDIIKIDLNGNGIRGFAYNTILKGYTFLSGPSAKQKVPFQLWLAPELNGDKPTRLSLPGRDGFEHAEGVDNINLDGKDYLLILSDDGSQKKDRGGHYILVPYDKLVR